MNLPTHLFDGDARVQTLLCQPDKSIIGEIIPYDYKANFKFNTYSEISFTVDKYYNDLLTGETLVHPYYEYIESLRVIYILGVGHFLIQDVEENLEDNDTKSITCFSLEYGTGNKYLESFYVNTGEEGSVETMYHAQTYGAEYSIDEYYTKISASDKFDPYERYYKKEYTSTNAYNYVEEQVLDASKFNAYINGTVGYDLYIKKYPNVRFYWPTCPELSLLHLVFDRIPEWKIGHVDKELWYQERTFSEDRTAVYDFLYNTAADTLDFVMVWDSINGTCSFYKTEEDGLIRDTYVRTNTYNPSFTYYIDDQGNLVGNQPKSEEEVQNGVYYVNIGSEIETQWDTDVFVSRENLAQSIDVKYSTDDIKTKLKITGSDDLDVRDVNLGQNYIMNLSYYAKDDKWFGPDLYKRYHEYVALLNENTEKYKEFISAWSAAYNEYSDLMNYVPVEPRVLQVGDSFDKLYCIYNPYLLITESTSDEYDADTKVYKYNQEDLSYYEDGTLETADWDSGNYYIYQNQPEGYSSTIDWLVTRLQNKLELYKVDQDDNGGHSTMARTDDVLLTLENDASDSVTIRVRYESENSDNYQVLRTLTSASTGVINTVAFSLSEWVSGDLKATYESQDGRKMNLAGFKIKSIGTLGAFFCLTRDETNKAELEDYGVRLLEEKQDTYTQIFITQTEGYMNKEGSQCVASDEEPTGDEYPVGTKWLDTDDVDSEGKLIIKERQSDGSWERITPDDNDYENYARFDENYRKLGNVQAVLEEKKEVATYLLDGFAVNTMYLTSENINPQNLWNAAIIHFATDGNKVYITNQGDAMPNDVGDKDIWFLVEDDGNVVVRQWGSDNKNWNVITIDIPSMDDVVYDTEFQYITFTKDDTNYACYVIDGTPYVSYAHSQGLNLAKMNVIKEATDMNNFFEDYELVRLSPFIREDEFSDSNFLLMGYESEEEQMNIKQELLNAGVEELKKICQPKLSFDCTMANILAIPEFAPIRNQFKLGNFIKVDVGDKYVKRARLLEVSIDFDDPSDFSATFGDLITTRSEIDKHAELLQQAVTAGKSVASNQSKWQKGADVATSLDKAIADGLKEGALAVSSAKGQSISWDSRGILGRKLREGTEDVYEDEQFILTNNKLCFTSDGWKTSKGIFGSYKIGNETRWGILAEHLTADTIEGKTLKGGTIEIGGDGGIFRVNANGSVEITTTTGDSIYASQNDLKVFDDARRFHTAIEYSGSTVFSTSNSSRVLTAKVYSWNEDITDAVMDNNAKFSWIRSSSSSSSDADWNNRHKNQTTNTITIYPSDVVNNATFQVEVTIDDTGL